MKITNAFAELAPGDRFVWNDHLHTKLNTESAVCHTQRGSGQKLNGIYSFEPETPVTFLEIDALVIMDGERVRSTI
jgi:hypothetical protein